MLDRFGARTALDRRTAARLHVRAPRRVHAVVQFDLALPVFFIGIADSIWVIAREIAGVDLVRADQRGRVLERLSRHQLSRPRLRPADRRLLTEHVGFRAVFLAYAACAALSTLLGWPSKHGHHQPPTPSANRQLRVGASPLSAQRLRGLRDLFYQIRPGLRATYIVLVLATFTSFVHRVTTQSIVPLFASADTGTDAQRYRHAVYDLRVFGFRDDLARGLCHR